MTFRALHVEMTIMHTIFYTPFRISSSGPELYSSLFVEEKLVSHLHN